MTVDLTDVAKQVRGLFYNSGPDDRHCLRAGGFQMRDVSEPINPVNDGAFPQSEGILLRRYALSARCGLLRCAGG